MPDKSKSSNTLMAVLCYFGILVLIPLVSETKNDAFVKFHIKQGLVLLIAYIISSFFMRLPLVGWLLGVVLFVLFLIGVSNAVTGKETPLPIIGKYADKLKI